MYVCGGGVQRERKRDLLPISGRVRGRRRKTDREITVQTSSLRSLAISTHPSLTFDLVSCHDLAHGERSTLIILDSDGYVYLQTPS